MTRKFCREYSVAILGDLFSAGENEPDESQEDNQGLKNSLDSQSEKRLRAVVTLFLITAREDLAPAQRARLYDLADKRLNNTDSVALLALRMLADSAEASSLEQALLLRTIKTIDNRPPPSSD